jgi:hypothetical protein
MEPAADADAASTALGVVRVVQSRLHVGGSIGRTLSAFLVFVDGSVREERRSMLDHWIEMHRVHSVSLWPCGGSFCEAL